MEEVAQLPQNLQKPLSKRYKSYPVSHFSRWRFYFYYLTLYTLVYGFVRLTSRWTIYGRQHIPKSGKYIVAANHITSKDPPFVALALRCPVAFMAKKELFGTWLSAEFYRTHGCFALDRDNPDSSTLRTAFNVLRSPNKWVLGIFPEGTRSMDGAVLPLKKGIGGLAQKTGTPILPIGISQDPDKRFIVTIGELITDVSDADQVQEEVYKQLVHLTDRSWPRQ